MKIETVNKFINHCNKVKELGISYAQYAELHVGHNYFSNTIRKIRESDLDETLKNKAIEIYESYRYNNKIESDSANISYERDSDGKIQYYVYEIYRKNKSPLCGKLTRDEMNLVYRLYSYYGDSLQQRIVSRQFPEWSLIDFKRILRAFEITKASAPFAPHMFEELTEEELLEIQMREKENSFLRKAEEERIKNNEKLLNKYAQENIELKKQIESISKFEISIPKDDIKPTLLPNNVPSNNDLILYLSDMHIGATLTDGALYSENIAYGEAEVRRRLEQLLIRIKSLSRFNNIIINLMGDNIDCCGMDGRTARLDHYMPENMDARKQANTYIEIMLWFVDTIIVNDMCNNIKIYSVPCGNHDGNFGYMTTKALLAIINAKYPQIYTEMFEKFYGVFEHRGHTFVLCHGKDGQHMKRGLPLNLDDKSKSLIYEWLHANNISGDNIHIVKGDLHSSNLNSCRMFDYRNVLSLFGASDYSNYNFSRNSYGVSYDMFISNNFIRGTFENI